MIKAKTKYARSCAQKASTHTRISAKFRILQRITAAAVSVVLAAGLLPAVSLAEEAAQAGDAAQAETAAQANATSISTPQEASTVTIGTGTSFDKVAPYCSYYKNSGTQMIYTAEEIGSAGTISALAFSVGTKGSADQTAFNVYLGTTDKDTFSGSADALSASELTCVYSNTNQTIGSATGWETVTFTTPFEYDGTSNLVVAVYRQGTYNTSLKYHYTYAAGKTLYRQNDGTASYGKIDGTEPYSTSGNRPNIQLTIEQCTHSELIYHDAVAPACGTGNIAYYSCNKCGKMFSDEAGTTSISTNKASHTYNAGVVTTQPTCETAGTTTYTCSVCNETKTESKPAANGHNYTGAVTSNNNGTHNIACVNTNCTKTSQVSCTMEDTGVAQAATCTTTGTMNTECSVCHYTSTRTIDATGHRYENGKCKVCGAAEPITIGEGTDTTDKYGPYGYTFYENSVTETLYLASELTNINGAIESIAFQASNAKKFTPNDKVLIYLANTDASTVSTSSWIPASEFSLVYEGTPTLGAQTGWETIELTTSFDYESGKNLAIAIVRSGTNYTTSSTGHQGYYQTATTEQLYAQRYAGSSYAASFADLSSALQASVGTTLDPKCRPNIQLGYVHCDHALTKTEEKPATCTTAGTKAYWTCSKCSKLFADDQAATSISQPVEIAALGHNFTAYSNNNDSETHNIVCSRCAAVQPTGQSVEQCSNLSSGNQYMIVVKGYAVSCENGNESGTNRAAVAYSAGNTPIDNTLLWEYTESNALQSAETNQYLNIGENYYNLVMESTPSTTWELENGVLRGTKTGTSTTCYLSKPGNFIIGATSATTDEHLYEVTYLESSEAHCFDANYTCTKCKYEMPLVVNETHVYNTAPFASVAGSGEVAQPLYLVTATLTHCAKGYTPAVNNAPLVCDGQTYKTLVDAETAQALEAGTLKVQGISGTAASMPAVKGDVNNSGKLNIVDAQVAYDISRARYSADDLPLVCFLAADVNTTNIKEAEVNALDAFAIQHALHCGWE